MARPVKKSIDWLLIAAVIGPILGAALAMMSRGFIEERQLADKPYVQQFHDQSIKYTNEKSEQVRRDAFEHSDTNKREMKLEMEQMNTEYRTNSAIFSGKLDVVIETVKGLRDDISRRRK